MTDRPIIFSGPMVHALLAGRKTQTRRLATSPLKQVEVGDRLWVRETFAAEELSRPPTKRPATPRERRETGRTHLTFLNELDGADGLRYAADGEWQRIPNTMEAGEAWGQAFHYGLKGGARPKGLVGRSIPSIHMPRWASRLTLVVEDVRTERLQAISARDAKAEGVVWDSADGFDVFYVPGANLPHTATAPECFAGLWGSLHGEQGERWQDDPHVVALTFRVERGNVDRGAPE